MLKFSAEWRISDATKTGGILIKIKCVDILGRGGVGEGGSKLKISFILC